MKLFSDKFLEKLLGIINIDISEQRKRVDLIEEAKELPSPLPRLSTNLAFVNELRDLIKKHFNGKLVRVTDTNSMEPLIDYGHLAILIPFNENKNILSKTSLIEGDIIEFYRISDGTPSVMHRIVTKRDEEVVITRGDNTVILDGFTVKKYIKHFCGGILYWTRNNQCFEFNEHNDFSPYPLNYPYFIDFNLSNLERFK